MTAKSKHLRSRGMPIRAFRIAYAGEQGFGLHLPFSYRLSLWDLLLVLRLRHYGVSSA